MDQDQAKALFENGGVMIIEDMPIGNEFGIDYNCWNVGERFQGLKMIPPGFHFVYTKAVSATNVGCHDRNDLVSINTDIGPRCGFFHFFTEREIMQLRWNKHDELMIHKETTHEDTERIRDSLQLLDRNLGPYPYESHVKWCNLTNYICQEVILKIQPICKVVYSVSHVVPKEFHSSRQNKHIATEEDLTTFKLDPNTCLRFSLIPTNKFPEGSTPDEVTKHSIDKSYTLDYVIAACHGNDDKKLLGELQLAFICFLIGQVYEGFEQWKRIVALLCSCESIILKRREFYVAVLEILGAQLQEINEDFFVDIISKNNFLVTHLHTLFTNLEDLRTIDMELAKSATKLRNVLTDRFSWDFQCEPDDYAPVVVDT